MRVATEQLLITRRCRETGLAVELWRNLDGADGYAIICTEHSFVSQFERRTGPSGAEVFLSHPKSEGWCEVCSGSYDPEELDAIPAE